MVPDSAQLIAKRVDARIDDLLTAETARWTAVDASLAEPFAALRRLVLAGGKRLRPAFCQWAFVGAGGGAEDSRVVDAGAALELLHVFALVHDDIMDASAIRRGLPTIHVDFAARHAAAGWRGEHRRFGEGVAILVGDLAFVYADELLLGAPQAAIDVFNELRIEVNVGQYLDLRGAVSDDSGTGAAQRIALYKSAKYTVERPLHLGAALAGRLEALREPLSAFGLPLGEAFQLRDDVLGAFGDETVTGKPVGEDLREGKPTRLRAWALERAGDGERAALAEYGSPDLDTDGVAAIQHALVSTGALATAEDEIARLVGEATASLEHAPLTAEARERLGELAEFVAQRAH